MPSASQTIYCAASPSRAVAVGNLVCICFRCVNELYLRALTAILKFITSKETIMRARLSAAVLGVAVFRMFLSAGATAAEPSKADKVVKDGMVISLEYTLIGEDGKVMESNRGKEPLKYIQGEKTGMPPGLEKELVGMKVGQEKHVRLENATALSTH